MDEISPSNTENDKSAFYEPADFVSKLTDAQRARIRETNYGRDSGWMVEYAGEAIALLTEPQWEDMFWDSYQIVPLTHNERIISQLYSAELWHKFNEMTFRSREFGVIVLLAFPAANLSDLPTTRRILMRGLYINVDERAPLPPLKIVTWLREILCKVSTFCRCF